MTKRAKDIYGYDIQLNEDGICVYSPVNGSDEAHSKRLAYRKVHFDNLPPHIADNLEIPEDSRNPWF